jgi:hypothetical protein
VRKSLLILFAICAGSVPGAVFEEIFSYSCCNLRRKRSFFTYSFPLICAGSFPGAVFEEIFTYSFCNLRRKRSWSSNWGNLYLFFLQFAQEKFLEQYLRKSFLILVVICAGSVPGAVCEEIFTYSFCNLRRKRSWSSMWGNLYLFFLQFAQEAFLEQYLRKSLLILFAICAGRVPGAVCEEIFTYSFCNLRRKLSWSSIWGNLYLFFLQFAQESFLEQ